MDIVVSHCPKVFVSDKTAQGHTRVLALKLGRIGGKARIEISVIRKSALHFISIIIGLKIMQYQSPMLAVILLFLERQDCIPFFLHFFCFKFYLPALKSFLDSFIYLFAYSIQFNYFIFLPNIKLLYVAL